MDENDFEFLLNSERIAFYSNKLIVKEKNSNEYVDVIGNTCCGFHKDILQHINEFVRAKDVLKKDYNVDMYELPFKYEINKLEIKRQDLINQLEKKLTENNVPYKKDNIIMKGDLIKNSNAEIREIVSQISDIDIKIFNLQNEMKIPI